MSPWIGRARYRTQAGASSGGSTGSTGSTGATALVWAYSFDNLSTDQFEWVNGSTTPPLWGDATIGTSGDGLQPSGGWVCYGYPQGDRIVSSAGRSTGSTASSNRGFRHYIVYDPVALSGHNQVGGGIKIELDSTAIAGAPLREFWFQWWQRYGVGLTCENVSAIGADSTNGNGSWYFVKDMDFNNDGEPIGRVTFGQNQGANNCWGANNEFVSSQQHLPTTVTWQQQNGGSDAGAGIWNKYQVHMKADDGVTPNGELHMWFNGTLVASYTAVNFSGLVSSWVGWRSVRPGVNGSKVAKDSDINGSFTDYDDFKLSTTGYITQD